MLQHHFTEASALLFEASKRYVYFKNISILVPPSWIGSNYEDATNEVYHEANIVIHNDINGYRPHTKQYTGCGQEGEQTELKDTFFIDPVSTLPWFQAEFPPGKYTQHVDSNFSFSHTYMRGRTRGRVSITMHCPCLVAKTIVHEWSHLRWGVYDENPIDTDPGFQRFYHNNGEIIPVKCGKNLKGIMGTQYNPTTFGSKPQLIEGPCHLNPDTLLPDENCMWEASASETNQASASIMYTVNNDQVRKRMHHP